jgi:hypothetical protein
MAESQLNDYFDRLDAAFTKVPPAAPSRRRRSRRFLIPPQAEPEADINWFSRTEVESASTEPWDVPPPPADEGPLDLPI